MKVKVTLTIDVDPDAFNREYGSDDEPAEIADDIALRAYDAVGEEFRPFAPVTPIEAADRYFELPPGGARKWS